MIEVQNQIREQQDALITYKFLLLYNEFEVLVREIFKINWKNFSADFKLRVSYYAGWISSTNKYIDYNTYSIKQETYQYKENKILAGLTANQIIRLDQTERVIKAFDFEICSKSKKVVYLSHNCFLILISMRNKLAHDILNISWKNKDIIEILPFHKLVVDGDKWKTSIDEKMLSEFSRPILSNYIYMQDIVKILRREIRT